jgi:arabinan endo-1,5-alpha-L-arabinosidase
MRLHVAAAAAVLAAGAALGGCSAGGGEAGSPDEPELIDFAIDERFADPDVIAVDGGYAAFATGNWGLNVQVAQSPDLETWTVTRGDAMPLLPAWASPGRVWAPDVVPSPGGAGYTMYFTAEHTASGKQCIGVAQSDALEGPFVSGSPDPLVCPLEEGGAIDASTFTDVDGTTYLLWKNDGNCCDLDTWLQLAPLASDGLSLTGPATKLFSQTLPWEGDLVEAPVLVRHGDAYVMFYSANGYGGDEYAMGVATAHALTGPYEKRKEPLLSTESSGGRYLGPGGQDVLTTDEGDLLVFHSWDEQYTYRGMQIAPLEWDGDEPRVVLPG